MHSGNTHAREDHEDVSASLEGLLSSEIPSIARALRTGGVSPLELANAALVQLDAVGASFRAVSVLTPERARVEAARSARRLKEGRAHTLTGVPYGVKDLIQAWEKVEAARDTRDAVVVRRLARQGGVLAAKLSVENAGAGWAWLAATTIAETHGRGRRRFPGYGVNPWDRSRWSGGSSSGPAIAVAAGTLPFALGTETSGSVVAPAAYCGLSALRPTHDPAVLTGVVSLAWSLDKVGIFAHAIEDCALVFATMTRRDPATVTDSEVRRRAVRAKLRLGVLAEDIAGASDAARATLTAGLEELAALGVSLRDTGIADGQYDAMVEVVMRAEGAVTFGDLIRVAALSEVAEPRQVAGLKDALRVTAHDYLRTMRQRDELRASFGELFHAYDVLVAPAQPRTAPALRHMPSPSHDAAQEMARVGRSRITPAANLAGLPAVVIPCGFGSDGLPVALQLVGPPRSEALLLGLARAYQAETSHHRARPTDPSRDAHNSAPAQLGPPIS